MKIRRWLLLGMIFCATLFGCAKESGTEMTVYSVHPEGNGLVQETYHRRADQGTESVEEVIEKLGITPQEYTLEHGVLRVVFDETYHDQSTSMEVLFRASVVQTMVQLPDVNSVMFYVGEEPITDMEGIPLGAMDENDFIQNIGSSLKSYQSTDLKLYFADKEGTGLVLEQKTNVHYNANTLKEKLIVERLMKGTSAKGRNATIAESIKLIGVTVRDGICYVNFDSAFLTDGYDQSPEVVIYSIVNSIVANGTVTQVQILVDGTSDVVYKGTVDLSKPFLWNSDLIGG